MGPIEHLTLHTFHHWYDKHKQWDRVRQLCVTNGPIHGSSDSQSHRSSSVLRSTEQPRAVLGIQATRRSEERSVGKGMMNNAMKSIHQHMSCLLFEAILAVSNRNATKSVRQ